MSGRSWHGEIAHVLWPGYDSHRLIDSLIPLKSPALPGFLVLNTDYQLLDLGFLVHHMLANHWIEFFHFQLFRHGALVLGSGVKVASLSR
jgi:hypothetical protein